MLRLVAFEATTCPGRAGTTATRPEASGLKVASRGGLSIPRPSLAK
jgi:hypothetical protein